ncbi:MAG: hypothetical protein JW954_05570 [Dehalococcoidaceae bacterium]|nr:hypothetical protein [Dehalococcoidaceae bacterium]
MIKLSKNSVFLTIITCSIAFVAGSLPVLANIQTESIDTLQNDSQIDEQYSIASLNALIVTVNGLKEGDQAIISLLPSRSSDKDIPLLEKIVTGGKTAEIDMSLPLKDGYYKLQIVADETYFREPKAWLFSVIDSELVNPMGKSAVFELIPPENQKYQPKREPEDPVSQLEAGSAPPPSNEPKVMAECMLSLSATPKEPIMSKSTGAHQFGYWSTLDCPGIWGRFEVVDPGVRHGATGEIALDHIYANDSTGDQWMEIGWAEVNFDDDVQYLFEYDSYREDWRLYDLPANPIEVSLFNYSSTIWTAMYQDNGWTVMASENVGFSDASNQFNAGEVRTGYDTHPSFPEADTDISKLYISNQWQNWDWQRWATTYTLTCDTYDIHTSTAYYDFYIHKH